jgi:hypothetical protein
MPWQPQQQQMQQQTQADKEWCAWKLELERLDKLAKDQKAMADDEKICIKFLHRQLRATTLAAFIFDYRRKPWKN